jgi:hypothetical protein
MIITKTLEVGINIQNCISVCTDMNNILSILANDYEGKCFKSCYIVKIEKIVRTSRCMIAQDVEPTFGTISVMFQATVIVYTPGEVINGCKVLKRDQKGNLTCATNIADIVVAAHQNTASISEGQIVSIRVGRVGYNALSNRVSIGGLIFLPQSVYPIYKISGTVNLELLQNVLSRIAFEESEADRMKKENPKAWAAIDELLQPYKELPKKPQDAELIDIRIQQPDALKNVKYITRMGVRTTLANAYGSVAQPLGKILLFPITDVVILLLEDYCASLRIVREMIEIYKDEKLLASHKNIFELIRKNKA